MHSKGDKTRALILENAVKLFSQKGFTAVAMSDFCAACELSRGGLYRYFSSTSEIFTAMLEADKSDAEESLNAAIDAEMPAERLLEYFLEQQANGVKAGNGRLSLAICEFCAADPDRRRFMERRFKSAVDILCVLLRYGQRKGVFAEFEPESAARHIVVFLEGLKVASVGTPISDELISEQMEFISNMIIKER